jgi:hypothetical protein
MKAGKRDEAQEEVPDAGSIPHAMTLAQQVRRPQLRSRRYQRGSCRRLSPTGDASLLSSTRQTCSVEAAFCTADATHLPIEERRLAALRRPQTRSCQFLGGVGYPFAVCRGIRALPVASHVVTVRVVVDALAAPDADVRVVGYSEALPPPVLPWWRITSGAVLHLVELTTLKRIYPFASHMLELRVRWAVGLPSPGVAPTSARPPAGRRITAQDDAPSVPQHDGT